MPSKILIKFSLLEDRLLVLSKRRRTLAVSYNLREMIYERWAWSRECCSRFEACYVGSVFRSVKVGLTLYLATSLVNQ